MLRRPMLFGFLYHKWGVLLVGVLTRALLFGVYIRLHLDLGRCRLGTPPFIGGAVGALPRVTSIVCDPMF